LAIDSDWNARGGWLARFLSPTELCSVVETLATRHFAWERPTLLVIDYAAQCHEALARWLDRLAGQRLDSKLRIPLLDREAPEGFGWRRELIGSGLNTARGRRDLFYAERPRWLPDLSDLKERRDLMAAALQGALSRKPGRELAAYRVACRMTPLCYRRHRFPPKIIQHAIWLYLRFTLSYRDVEELLAERGLDISYETVRRWVLKFGPAIARRLRQRRPQPSDRWHLDEMVVRIAGKRMYLWRAVDHEGEVLDMLVQTDATVGQRCG
jgi:hypothetical protein